MKKTERCERMHEQRKEKKAKKRYGIFCVVPALIVCALLFVGAADTAIPDTVYRDELATYSSETLSGVSAETQEQNYDVEYTAKLFGVLPAKNIKSTVSSDFCVVPCGDVFGVKFFTKGVVITDMSDVESNEGIICPAKKAGLKTGDVITKIDGKEINTVEQMGKAVSDYNKGTMTVEFNRDEKNYKAKLLPVKSSSDGNYKAGMWVRDSTAGIGTVTFYDPEDKSFAGLGHGIYDADTQLLLPLLKGAVVDISVTDIVKGRNGFPGEIKGSFSDIKTGSLSGNTVSGVFGFLNKAPQTVYEKMPCALKNEVKTGNATILCNVDGKGVCEYDIKIAKIYTGEEPTKNFVIEVCDDRLLAKTGGIVRGMSGSPIIQNGKLVGAVTHVLVSDSKKGYGIFIENMLLGKS